MALGAIRAERAQMFLRLGMAIDACLRCALENIVDVAAVAWHVDVRAGEFEDREIVIELSVGPVRGIVARGTVRTIAPRMCPRFVGLMTTHARLRRAFENVVDVALIATHFGMLPRQRERRQIVIELRPFPTLRRVTLGAVRAERSVVRVIFAMAIDAGWGRLFEISHGAGVGVAAPTGDVAVFAA